MTRQDKNLRSFPFSKQCEAQEHCVQKLEIDFFIHKFVQFTFKTMLLFFFLNLFFSFSCLFHQNQYFISFLNVLGSCFQAFNLVKLQRKLRGRTMSAFLSQDQTSQIQLMLFDCSSEAGAQLLQQLKPGRFKIDLQQYLVTVKSLKFYIIITSDFTYQQVSAQQLVGCDCCISLQSCLPRLLQSFFFFPSQSSDYFGSEDCSLFS